jgi:hypothetical protein
MLARSDQQPSLTDPDARSMKSRDGGIVGKNVQMAVDAKHQLIVAHEVVTAGIDREQLTPMAEQARAATGIDALAVVADRGHDKSEQIRQCDAAGITPLVPKSLTSNSKAEGRFDKQGFIYIASDYEYRCPAATYCETSIGLANIRPTWPATRLVTAGPPPLYGTCVKSAPLRVLNSSVASCGTLPLPGDAYISVPGLALDSANGSGRVLPRRPRIRSVGHGRKRDTAISSPLHADGRSTAQGEVSWRQALRSNTVHRFRNLQRLPEDFACAMLLQPAQRNPASIEVRRSSASDCQPNSIWRRIVESKWRWNMWQTMASIGFQSQPGRLQLTYRVVTATSVRRPGSSCNV